MTNIVKDNDGNIWGANGVNLWRYDIAERSVTEFGDRWMSAEFSPSRLTTMMVSRHNHLLMGTEHGIYLLRDGQLHFVADSASFGVVISMEEGEDDQIWVASHYGVHILDLRNGRFEAVPLIDEHISPKCLLNNNTGMWLTSSSGLTHYSEGGAFVAHYGQPFGVINNEFQNDYCLSAVSNSESLLLGSWRSIIRVNSEDLVVSPLPESRVIFSQIRVNQNLVSFGSISQAEIIAPYGDPITIQIGLLPHVNGTRLEFRLNDERRWTHLDGHKILIDGLAPGDYRLYVRPVIDGVERRSKSVKFSVIEPWYLTPSAMVLYVMSSVALMLIVIFLRSRVMLQSNRKLKAQVALKTNQLRHQSRILLSNNHQLRKQLQVRRIIFTQAVQSFKERLLHSKAFISDEEGSVQNNIVDSISYELELLLHVRESQSEEIAAYNLSLILSSILDGWRDDLSRAGLSVEVDASTSKGKYVLIEYFNLDVLFNLLLDGLVKRCFRHQVIYVQTQYVEDRVILTITDYGLAIEAENSSRWSEVLSLVDTSGGALSLQSTDGKNVVTMTWKSSQGFDENSVIEFPNFRKIADSEGQVDDQDPWIEKLEGLVRQYYSDSDFSTSTAAKLMFVSERSLQRRFKSATQRTFTDYLSEVRLDSACRRLLAGMKVSEVAFACGFNDPSYFSQRFKHRFGVSPTQFVEEKYPQVEIGADI